MIRLTETDATPHILAAARERPVEDGPPMALVPVASPADRGRPALPMPLTAPPRAPAGSEPPWTHDMLETARRTCERSQALIEESRAALSRLDTVMEALRRTTRASRGARERQALRRGAMTAGSDPARELDETVVVGELVLLPLRTAVVGTGKPVHLTPAEWQLLATLVRHRAEVLGRAGLATRAWGPAFADRHSEVEVYISRLRRKLARAGTRATIRTVRGLGYQLRVHPEPEEGDGG